VSEWQDISTARPIEFVDIVLLARAGKKGVMPAFWDGDKWRALTIVGPMEYLNPSVWQPLPVAPPSPTPDAGGAGDVT